MRIIPSRIAEARRLGGMSQRDLANALGVTVQAVSQWENGKTDASTRLSSLAVALKCDPAFLINTDYEENVQRERREGINLQSVGNRVALVSIDNATKWIFDQRTTSSVQEILIRDLFASHPISLNGFAIQVSLKSDHFDVGDILIFDRKDPEKGDYVCGVELKSSISQIHSLPNGAPSLAGATGMIMRLTGSDTDEFTGQRVRVRQEDDTSEASNSVIIIGTLIERRTFPARFRSA